MEAPHKKDVPDIIGLPPPRKLTTGVQTSDQVLSRALRVIPGRHYG
jgi:hypothetical protein